MKKVARAIPRVDHLKPSPALLSKLGSAIVHAAEGRDARGHAFDWVAFDTLVYSDPDVREWLRMMNDDGLLPIKRNAGMKTGAP